MAWSNECHPTECQTRESHTDAHSVQHVLHCLCWITEEEIIIIIGGVLLLPLSSVLRGTIRAEENRNVLVSNAVAFIHRFKAEKHVVRTRIFSEHALSFNITRFAFSWVRRQNVLKFC